jgi:hypothetical protein
VYPTQTWTTFMAGALKGKKVEDFDIGPGVKGTATPTPEPTDTAPPVVTSKPTGGFTFPPFTLPPFGGGGGTHPTPTPTAHPTSDPTSPASDPPATTPEPTVDCTRHPRLPECRDVGGGGSP